MGVTKTDIEILERLIKLYQPRRVIDLGVQNNFSNGEPMDKAPYMSEWYYSKGIVYYDSIDTSGENNCNTTDLSKPAIVTFKADFVTDFGTSEHIEKKGKFSWRAIYNCWLNKHNLLKIGGLMINENPKTGNWPDHGFSYYTLDFYIKLISMAGYTMEEFTEIPAMGNTKDGYNIFCVMRKFSDKFPTLEEFKTLDLRQK